MTDHAILLTEYPLHAGLTLKNRIVMAPMTRAQAAPGHLPTPAMADYYARRAEAGLIITEGTIITADALGYHSVPGIYNTAQIAAWQRVTDQVHQRDGRIFQQIWHVGRVSHPVFLQGKRPIAPSTTTMTTRIARMPGYHYGESRAATRAEIDALIQHYAQAAVHALQAGFDGIEIHGANGYLIDQFLHHHTNHRDDTYGGSPENMARFALDVVNACGQAIGYEHVGIRLSPGGYLNEITGVAADAPVFTYLLQQLNLLQIAYVHTGNFNDAQRFPELDDNTMTAFLRAHYQGTLIASGGYTFDNAAAGLNQQDFDLVAIGRPFIANPDLLSRLRHKTTLTRYDAAMLARLD